MALGTKLGKMNIATGASKDGEDRNASSLLKTDKQDQPNTTVTETRAAAWEDAEKPILSQVISGILEILF